MPTGTRVARCVDALKHKGSDVNPYAACQASTGQSYATGRTLGRAPNGSYKATNKRKREARA